MINLYQMLGISAYADQATIAQALQTKQASLPPKVVQAVQQWLLNPEVRIKYDEKLRLESPEFFQTTINPPSLAKPTIQPPPLPPLPPQNPNFNSHRTPYIAQQRVGAIYNPNVCALWSILFTPFGAYLHAKNWEVLGDEKLAEQNMLFVWVILAIIFAVFILDMLTGITIPNLVATLVPLLVWYTQLGKKQVSYVKENFGDGYARLSLVQPVLIGIVGGIIALVIIFTILSMLFGAFGLLHPKHLEG